MLSTRIGERDLSLYVLRMSLSQDLDKTDQLMSRKALLCR